MRRGFKINSKGSRRPQDAHKPQKPTRTNLIKKLDQIFSLFIRLKYADKNGFVQCYTCPNKKHYKQMQNGHYISRSVRIGRWSQDNCRPQCYGCNIMHGGNPITFRENLVKEYGEDFVKQMEARRFDIFKPTDEWLKEKIEFYQKQTPPQGGEFGA